MKRTYTADQLAEVLDKAIDRYYDRLITFEEDILNGETDASMIPYILETMASMRDLLDKTQSVPAVEFLGLVLEKPPELDGTYPVRYGKFNAHGAFQEIVRSVFQEAEEAVA